MIRLKMQAVYPSTEPLELLVRGDAIVALDASYEYEPGAPRTRVVYVGPQAFTILDIPENTEPILAVLASKWGGS